MINEGKSDTYEIDLKHERGHCDQLFLLGPKRYLRKVAIPSIAYNLLDRNFPDTAYYYSLYYSLPWERGADSFGGVNDRAYIIDKNGWISMLYLLTP